jgi:sec-independent protein translocase protein TatA
MIGLSDLIMGIVNTTEVIILLIVIVAVIFGAKKIPDLARSIGRASTEYEKAKVMARRELQSVKNSAPNPDREKLESIAETLGISYLGKTDDELRTAIDAEINKKAAR